MDVNFVNSPIYKFSFKWIRLVCVGTSLLFWTTCNWHNENGLCLMFHFLLVLSHNSLRKWPYYPNTMQLTNELTIYKLYLYKIRTEKKEKKLKDLVLYGVCESLNSCRFGHRATHLNNGNANPK